jgi:hypothetical protein
MTNFIQVQLFDPKAYGIETDPFWINADHITRIIPYQVSLHSQQMYDPQNGYIPNTPEGAIETVYIRLEQQTYHLDVKSSQKVLIAIGAREGYIR